MEIYVIVLVIIPIIWFTYEIYLVLSDRKQGKGSTNIDKGTRVINFGSLLIGILGAGIISGIPIFFFPRGRTPLMFWVGIVIMLLGFVLRYWAVNTLGRSFRTTIETHSGQKVVNSGPYKLIRHPAYSGLIMMCFGYGIAVQNWLSLACVLILPTIALLYRIQKEEPLLLSALGQEYREYQKHTKKIIPWVY